LELEVTQKDIDDLVAFAEKDPNFMRSLQDLDQLAQQRKCELKDVVKTALEWYYGKK